MCSGLKSTIREPPARGVEKWPRASDDPVEDVDSGGGRLTALTDARELSFGIHMYPNVGWFALPRGAAGAWLVRHGAGRDLLRERQQVLTTSRPTGALRVRNSPPATRAALLRGNRASSATSATAARYPFMLFEQAACRPDRLAAACRDSATRSRMGCARESEDGALG